MHGGASTPIPVDVTFLTPIDPRRQHFLRDTADSVHRAQAVLKHAGVTTEWVVCFDGPGEEDPAAAAASAVVRCANQGGPAAARTSALARSAGRWICPVDADDRIEAEGVLAAIEALRDAELGWAGLSRTLLDGSATPHTLSDERRFAAGELASRWTSPFPFHPNSTIFDRRFLCASGGWPALATNEDLAAVLLVSELAGGIVIPEVLTRYRVWNDQMVASGDYGRQKAAAFRSIEAMVSARRALHARGPISAPNPGPAQRGARQ
jgi:glycosyltransferase involved in cell wall biosynthesis